MCRYRFRYLHSFLIGGFFFFASAQAHAAGCTIKTDYDPAIQCGNATFTANNDADLDNYLADYGLDKGKYQNLLINYNVDRSVIDIHSPCTITLNDGIVLTGASVCVDASNGITNDNGVTINATAGGAGLLSEKGSVELGKASSVNANEVAATALDTIKFGQGTQINSTGPMTVVSTDTSNNSKILISAGTQVAAADLTLQAYGVVNLDDTTVINASGAVAFTSTGSGNQSQVKLGKNVALTAASIDITSGSKAILSKDSVVASAGNFNMQADTESDCIIDSAATFSASSVSGNCLEGATVIPNVAGMLKTDAEGAITAAGFAVGNENGIYRLDKKSEHVIAQSPAGGTVATLGTAVDILYVLTPPAGGETLSAAWEGLWEISLTYKDPTGKIIGKETVQDVLCEGDATGAALAELAAGFIPEVYLLQCVESTDDAQIGATCGIRVDYPGYCLVDAELSIGVNRDGDTISGQGSFDANSLCDFENHQKITVTGTRLGPDPAGLCDQPPSTVIQKFMKHPLGSITGQL